MNETQPETPSATTRRDFLKTSTKVAAGAALAAGLPRPGYTAGTDTIKVALIGCGGRGTGAAAQALSTPGPTQLWAVADVFEYRLNGALNQLRQSKPDQADVPPERRFIGFDAYRRAIDALGAGGVVLLATPPAFRPMHVEYAVSRGCHVFMEKSFAVDAPGIRRILAAGKAAEAKNLKVAGGLMSRHYVPLEEAVKQIHDGLIGDVITAWAYRMHGPVGMSNKGANTSELAHQIANYSCFTWLNGSFIVDWLIHNIDICCWVKDAWPVSVRGMGGRQTRTQPDQLFDQYFAEYTFPDGTRLAAQGRHINNCWDFFGDKIQGTRGLAILGEGQPNPFIYKGHQPLPANVIWRYRGGQHDPYQHEHNLLFDAIRNDQPYNETERCARACLTAIMGRMACESGKEITYEEALASNLELAPNLARITNLDAAPPASATPDADGHYPVAMPGTTQVL
ncbi:MAG: Gfo/Idh/MocA family oxidoreductase [Verrucomicrobiales bacterium]|nr:Gfo/Idh/MocA family oxidoreductase [Verrucomicrobiales bacterium]